MRDAARPGGLRSPNRRRVGPALLALALGAGLVACGGAEGGTPTLTWYTNPDNGGQRELAAKCTERAEGRYRIEVSELPADADSQREQLVRRLAANDSSIDLMSLDVVFVPEFAEAGFLRPFTEGEARPLTEDVLDGPLATTEWEGEVVAAPFWANTQLLWYRRSVAEAAGIDPAAEDVTWDDVIDAAVATGTTVEVTGARYEGYMVWINTLVASAGGEIVEDPDAGRDARPALDSPAGRRAAEVIRRLAHEAANPSLSTAIEENARAGFQSDNGGFMVNWPYVYQAAQSAVEEGSLDPEVFDDIAWARVPRVDPDRESAPPLGGIDLGIGAFTDHPDLAVEAVTCITELESQIEYMLAEGNSGARAAVYDDPEVRDAFPMADLIRESIDSAAPRPRSSYYPDISAATVREFHPPRSVDPETTPADADRLIVDVLQDRELL
ncbi:MAG TPA: extracellular solute-binding protein [Acidimicrobiales bacterium]|nr:extracellular solute-binding protein [Acidimicrobiales bacterium]